MLLSPLIILVSLAIKLDSRGPLLCRLKYYKLDDAVFDAFEFRSTICDPRNNIIETTANRGHNITRIGQILRSSGIDKIPQFINVLRGDMSLVGPQPLMTACGAEYRARIDPKLLRNVRPGVAAAEVRSAGAAVLRLFRRLPGLPARQLIVARRTSMGKRYRRGGFAAPEADVVRFVQTTQSSSPRSSAWSSRPRWAIPCGP
jgi:hypothetical protein